MSTNNPLFNSETVSNQQNAAFQYKNFKSLILDAELEVELARAEYVETDAAHVRYEFAPSAYADVFESEEHGRMYFGYECERAGRRLAAARKRLTAACDAYLSAVRDDQKKAKNLFDAGFECYGWKDSRTQAAFKANEAAEKRTNVAERFVSHYRNTYTLF